MVMLFERLDAARDNALPDMQTVWNRALSEQGRASCLRLTTGMRSPP